MHLDDLFPLKSCTHPMRAAILAEFGGRCPTVREVISVPDARWLKAPGVGPFILKGFYHLTQDLLRSSEDRPLAGLTNAELLSERDHIRRELNRLKSNLQSVTVELLSRGVAVPGVNSGKTTEKRSIRPGRGSTDSPWLGRFDCGREFRGRPYMELKSSVWTMVLTPMADVAWFSAATVGRLAHAKAHHNEKEQSQPPRCPDPCQNPDRGSTSRTGERACSRRPRPVEISELATLAQGRVIIILSLRLSYLGKQPSGAWTRG
jgi:hypothetical protein